MGDSLLLLHQATRHSQLHDVLLSEITVAGMDDPPAEVRALFESFLRQLSLPRLVHFFDLVLAQMIPRWETSAGQARSRLVCHVLRLWNDAWHRGAQRPNICFSFRRQFVSRAGIEHIAVHWQQNEVLLFTDPEHVELLDTNEFRSATALEHHRKNVQLGPTKEPAENPHTRKEQHGVMGTSWTSADEVFEWKLVDSSQH